MTRTDMPAAPDERTHLTTFLDYVRDTAVAKCEGLSAEDARRAPLPHSPLMTAAGVISHLRWVEHYWLDFVFLGGEDRAPWAPEDPDREMRIALDVPLPRLVAEYAEQADRLRRVVAEHDLDAEAERPVRDGVRVTLRWILLHLIEETARHNGHLDAIRELTDGRTGT
ncbi:DinB family protein [Streptomyces sudanensis]|uniref:DinB family protein n=1 Tax=Streptomyces sudanensis TaxID=436397 RepID=UPI0020CF95B6|nr:DinB family protein [Streptomyces sudanensis]MCP9958537.1 DinB family protein [Streptomyces sudanensis]MCP9987653.1 DinB family protein [Streptomyces sudanensis]MCQ0000952.1 DinB family protein [Streptomyces sudanensis]